VRGAALAGALALACRAAATQSGTARVALTVTGTTQTVHFEVPVVAERCGPGHGMMIHGEAGSTGVLVWLRDSAALRTGTYPLLSRGDTAAPRGAIASARFVVSQRTGGITIDDGQLTLSRDTPPFDLEVKGVGVETAFAQQRQAELTLTGVPLLPDSVPCRVEP
jgi:hypothetical protein